MVGYFKEFRQIKWKDKSVQSAILNSINRILNSVNIDNRKLFSLNQETNGLTLWKYVRHYDS